MTELRQITRRTKQAADLKPDSVASGLTFLIGNFILSPSSILQFWEL